MDNVIPFPATQIEHYKIDYDPITHAVDIEKIPQDVMSAVCILAVLVRRILEKGVLTADEIDQVAAQAAGKL